jgi:hypothetical protein
MRINDTDSAAGADVLADRVEESKSTVTKSKSWAWGIIKGAVEGVRRWPIFLCIAHTLLKLLATKALPIELPSLNWSWYKQENTVGQVRQRLTGACRLPISRTRRQTQPRRK